MGVVDLHCETSMDRKGRRERRVRVQRKQHVTPNDKSTRNTFFETCSIPEKSIMANVKPDQSREYRHHRTTAQR